MSRQKDDLIVETILSNMDNRGVAYTTKAKLARRLFKTIKRSSFFDIKTPELRILYNMLRLHRMEKDLSVKWPGIFGSTADMDELHELSASQLAQWLLQYDDVESQAYKHLMVNASVIDVVDNHIYSKGLGHLLETIKSRTGDKYIVKCFNGGIS